MRNLDIERLVSDGELLLRCLEADEEAFQVVLRVLEGETDAGVFPSPERVLALVVRKNELAKRRELLTTAIKQSTEMQERWRARWLADTILATANPDPAQVTSFHEARARVVRGRK